MDASALDKAISILEKAISRLEEYSGELDSRLIVWTLLVGVGVAIEVWVVLKEHFDAYKAWRRASIRSPEKPTIVTLLLQLAGPVFVTVGIGGELLTNVQSMGGEYGTAK